MIKYWFLSNGKLLQSYYLTIGAAIACATLETSMAFAHPEQTSIIFFDALYIWMAIMAIKGILRIKEENSAQ